MSDARRKAHEAYEEVCARPHDDNGWLRIRYRAIEAALDAYDSARPATEPSAELVEEIPSTLWNELNHMLLRFDASMIFSRRAGIIREFHKIYSAHLAPRLMSEAAEKVIEAAVKWREKTAIYGGSCMEDRMLATKIETYMAKSAPPVERVELQPCPFCGCNAKMFPSSDIMGAGGMRYDVACMECEAGTQEHQSEADAIAAWNRRVPIERKP